MISKLDKFRKTLDDIMLKAMHNNVLLFGYESYTGRFLKWYAEYYHSINIEYLVSTDTSRGRAYDSEIFRPSIIEFDYRDVKSAVIWIAEPITKEIKVFLENNGYIKDDTYFDFYEAVYGMDIQGVNEKNIDVFRRKKEGRRDIQFLEWLEWKYDCNFVTRIPKEYYEKMENRGSGYGVTTQKEIFPMLDMSHCKPKEKDAIFDYGCGKGGALISFLDYGFDQGGGRI